MVHASLFALFKINLLQNNLNKKVRATVISRPCGSGILLLMAMANAGIFGISAYLAKRACFRAWTSLFVKSAFVIWVIAGSATIS